MAWERQRLTRPGDRVSTPVKRDAERSVSASGMVAKILGMQQTLGNQTVQRLFKSGALQAKLKIGQPNDIYEQEADRIAEQITGMAGPQVSMKTVDDGYSQTSVVPDVVHEVLHSPGQPLDSETRTFFEPRLSYDFSKVRVHTDSKSDQSTKAIKAKAFTLGNDIVFGAGQYTPYTADGKKLLAHELTHVVQQEGRSIRTLMSQRIIQTKTEEKPCEKINPIVIASAPRSVPKVAEDAVEKIFREGLEKSRKAGWLKMVLVDDYPDFKSNAHKEVGKCECASKVLVAGHGGSDATSAWQTMGSITGTRSWGTTDIGNNNGKLVGDDMFDNFRFCKPCEIWFGGCNFADSKAGVKFMRKIAGKTGCSVIAFLTKTTPNPETGWPEALEGEEGKKKKPPPE
jgi:hypothetical protein